MKFLKSLFGANYAKFYKQNCEISEHSKDWDRIFAIYKKSYFRRPKEFFQSKYRVYPGKVFGLPKEYQHFYMTMHWATGGWDSDSVIINPYDEKAKQALDIIEQLM